MNAEANELHTTAALNRSAALLRGAAGGFDDFAASLVPLRDALRTVEDLGNITAKKAAARLTRQLNHFEPSVTMIGQIKSGKTTLVNSMVGWPHLLPADVNPWTSVVTSLHLCPCELTPPTSARFRFFENGEWDKLVTGGGRIGELANRAGADEELSTIKAQVEMMREKTKARLGRKFEMLLGKEHVYGYFDRELVERYVCLGDDFDEATPVTKSQGRFADITKSADLRLHQGAFPINLCVRDTPGVNDTFMIREQITIKSIRDSRICVVVLSAHQALSSTDLALIRLISNVKSREVIIFVNRIDELSDPKVQVPQIRASILDTLETHKGPTDAQLIFGSALWAQQASLGSINGLPEASQAAMLNWAEVAEIGPNQSNDPHQLMWALSGLPTLFAAIAERVAEGEGRELTQTVTAATRNLINGIRMADNLDAKRQVGTTTLRMSHPEVLQALGRLQQQSIVSLQQALAALEDGFDQKVDRSHRTFLTRATEALAKHLEFYGEQSEWTYDPAGLRILLNSAYKIYGTKCQGAYTRAAKEAVQGYQALYHQALGLAEGVFDPHIPPPPRIPPPVSLGQTIALDLRGSWWKGWWMRRRSYEAHAKSFFNLIKAETDSLVDDLTGDQAQVVRADMLDQLQCFLTEQTEGLASLTDGGAVSADQLGQVLGVEDLQARDAALTAALDQLEGIGQ